MGKRHGSLKLVWIAAVVLASACTKKDTPKINHEGPIENEQRVEAPRGDAASEAKLNGINVSALAQERKANPNEGARSTVAKLGDVVLNANYFEDPRFANSTKMREVMTEFNASLLHLLQTRPEETETKKAVGKYVNTVLANCDQGLKGCTNLLLFRRDPGSAAIFLELARATEKQISATSTPEGKNRLVRLYYRYVMVAFDLKNQQMSEDLEFLYLNRASDYAQYMSSLPPEQKAAKDLKRHVEVFETILNNFKPNMQDPKDRERFKLFVDNFSPWSFSRKEPGPFGVGSTKMLELAAQNFLYDAQTKKLSDSFVKAIEKSQAPNDKDPSFRQIVGLLKSSNRGLFKSFDLDRALTGDASFLRDEYFFVIDRLYNEHLTPDDATAIWNGSKRDGQRFLKTFEAYVKVQLAYMITRTNTYFSEVYADKEETSTNVLFALAVDRRIRITSHWKGLAGRMDRVGTFFHRHMKTPGRSKDPDFLRINSLLTSLGRNIRLMAVYPNMMMMLAMLENIDTKIAFYGDSGYDEVRADTGLVKLFDGEFNPIFAFTYDVENGSKDPSRQAVRRLDNLYAFDSVLKNDSFNVFSSGQNKIDEKSFFEKIFAKIFVGEATDYRLHANRLRDLDLRNFLAICQQDKLLLEQGKQPGTAGQSFTLNYFELPEFTYMATTQKPGSKGKPALDFYGTSVSPIADKVKKNEQNYRLKMTFAESLLQIHREHLEFSGVTGEELARRTAEVRKALDVIEIPRTRFLTEVLRWHLQLSPCVNQIFKIEHARQRKLLAKEEAYLKDVWDRMKAAREGNAKPLDELNKTMNFSLQGESLPEAIAKPAAEEYKYFKRDFHLRLRKFMSEVAPNVVIHPPDFTSPEFANPGEPVVLAGTLSKEQFVQEAFKSYNGQFLNWLTNTSEPSVLSQRVRLALELFRLGSFPIYDWSQASCKPDDIQTCPVKQVSIKPEEAIKELGAAIDILSLKTKSGQPNEDVEILRKVGLPSRYSKSDLKLFFLDERDEPLPVFDKAYQMLFQEGESTPEKQPEMLLAANYFETEISSGYALSTTNPTVNRIMRRHYRGLYLDFRKRVDEFEAAVKRLQADGSKPNFELAYEIDAGTLRSIGASGSLLSPERVEDFKAHILNFDRATRGHFEPRPGDPDYGSGGGR